MDQAVQERLHVAQQELVAATEALFAFPPQGGNVRGRAESQARLDAAMADVERLRKALRLLGDNPAPAAAAAPVLPAPRAAPVPKTLGEKPLSESAFEAGRIEFQRTLRVHGLELNDHWRRLLPMIVPQVHLDWLEFCLDADGGWTCADAADALRARMVPARALLQRQAEFLRIAMKAGESVEAYARRYHALAVEARRAPDAELWCLTLRPELQLVLQQVRLARAPQGRGILPLPHFDDALALALECQRTVPGGHSGDRDSSPERTPASKKKKAKSFNCARHGPNFTHNTPECRVRQQEAGGADSSGSQGSSTPASTPRDRRDLSRVTCWRCNAKGHYADRCPNPPAQPGASAATMDAGGHTPASSSAPYTKEDADWVATMRQLWSNTTTGNMMLAATPKPPSPAPVGGNLLKAPLLLDGKRVQGLVDTGASHSLVNAGVARRLNLKVLPLGEPVSVLTADGGARKVTEFARSELTVRTQGLQERPRVVTSRLLMLDDLAYELILGLDILPSLGIEIHGLPDEFPEPADSPLEPPGSVLPDATPRAEDEAWLPEGGGARGLVEHPERLQILEAVHDLMMLNQSISPREVCTHPAALFRIPTGNAIPKARRQYPIPHALQPFVQKAVEGWLDQGVVKVVDGPPSEWQCRLMAAPKKNKTTKEVVGARVCLDPSHINEVLEETPTATSPLIADIVSRASGAEVISLLDGKSGYNQVAVHEPDQAKTHFVFEGVHYVFVRGPFGFKHTR